MTDRAGNPGTADIAFPAVAKGTQDLSAFAYAAATVTYGDLAPTVIAPTGVPTTLSYAATPATVCTVDSSTGELTIQGAGICTITATAALDANYDEGTATATVTVEPAGTLTLNLDPIATDNTVNFAEQELGFIISGDTGSEGGVSVTVRVGTEELTDTSSATSTPAAWSVIVLARSAYLTDSNVTVTVSASKTGFTSPGDLTRTVTVDLTAPTAPTYTAPDALKVGEAITAMSPLGGTDVDGYSAPGLPSGLTIDAGTGVIRGTPDMAADAASTTVTVTDRAGNPATATIAFPAVAKGTQDLSAFAYAAATATHGADAPALIAPEGARTTLSYTAAPAAVCTVDSATGALTLVGLGACTITATAEASDDYNEATATFTVTVEAAGALALTVDDIAGDGTVNIAEKTAGFTISGDTGPIGGAAVTVTVGSTVLSATSADADPATWSVTVPANAAYIVEGDLSVTVDATKAGFTAAVQVARTLTVDLIAPDGGLDAARHAPGRRGHRRRDPGHRRHRHRDVGGHRPAAGARHRRRDRRPLRHADGGQRRRRHRHGDGDRQGRQPRHSGHRLPGGREGHPGPVAPSPTAAARGDPRRRRPGPDRPGRGAHDPQLHGGAGDGVHRR